jgi:uncharacterized protein YdcH (DUF465 family)
MAKYLKVVFATFMMLMVLLALIADARWIKDLSEGLDLAVYIRIASLIGLFIAIFVAWGYKKKIETSQKYLRAQQVLAQAEISAEHKQREIGRREEALRAQFAEKESALNDEIRRIKFDYDERLSALKEQNMQLKETVATLMQAVRKGKESP